MDIILKGLTAEQATELVNYFRRSLRNDSEAWVQEYCKGLDGIDVQDINYMYRTNLVEVKLVTIDKI
jgi:DNA-binding protein Fis